MAIKGSHEEETISKWSQVKYFFLKHLIARKHFGHQKMVD
jgi:hypothetical protein